jgi:hypothetical protein
MREMMDSHFMIMDKSMIRSRLQLVNDTTNGPYFLPNSPDLVIVDLSDTLVAVASRMVLANRCPKLLNVDLSGSPDTGSEYTWRAFFQFVYSASLSKDITGKMDQSTFNRLVRTFLHQDVSTDDLFRAPDLDFPLITGDVILVPSVLERYSEDLESAGLHLLGGLAQRTNAPTIAGGGIRVDQRVLSCRSVYFRHLIDSREITGETQPIAFQGSALELAIVVHYMYRNVDRLISTLLLNGMKNLNVKQTLCFRMLELADELCLDDLRAACEWAVLQAMDQKRIHSTHVEAAMARLPGGTAYPFLKRAYKSFGE